MNRRHTHHAAAQPEYVHRVTNTGFCLVRLLVEPWLPSTNISAIGAGSPPDLCYLKVTIDIQSKTKYDYLKFTAVPPHRSHPTVSEPSS